MSDNSSDGAWFATVKSEAEIVGLTLVYRKIYYLIPFINESNNDGA